MNKEFIRVRSITDIIISSSLIILGSVLIALPTGAGVNITGFFLIFAGIILALILRTGYKDTETGERYKKKEFFFQQTSNSALAAAISSNPEMVDRTEEDKGNALRLDMYFSQSKGEAYLQLFEYVPYKYEPCTQIFRYEISKVSNLLK